MGQLYRKLTLKFRARSFTYLPVSSLRQGGLRIIVTWTLNVRCTDFRVYQRYSRHLTARDRNACSAGPTTGLCKCYTMSVWWKRGGRAGRIRKRVLRSVLRHYDVIVCRADPHFFFASGLAGVSLIIPALRYCRVSVVLPRRIKKWVIAFSPREASL